MLARHTLKNHQPTKCVSPNYQFPWLMMWPSHLFSVLYHSVYSITNVEQYENYFGNLPNQQENCHQMLTLTINTERKSGHSTLFQVCSTSYTASQMRNITRRASAINPVTNETTAIFVTVSCTDVITCYRK